ncbi:MAG: hypothetical protein JRC86_00595 [Deltaproteobacteria bacterium]|nr:hypothetical protein [Deltaproteobacteria bacterium]
MDPETTLIEALEWMLDASKSPDSAYPPLAAADKLRELADWLDNGGFAPKFSGDWDWPRK